MAEIQNEMDEAPLPAPRHTMWTKSSLDQAYF